MLERDFTAFALEHVEEMNIPVIEAEDGAGIAAWCIHFGAGRLAGTLSEAERRTFEEELAWEARR